ncbi:hypothetical protein L1987_54993 [Smallanthus sonchifolius]|uniref:Uncharacterized protein n=1 Tax=Smallanthus sonchifolius TaxID=185202 RepID=A0ACB9E8S2_9ASTR|nr:hypothetical protein L1987_54993 [Smallanthus sonchifolius]
MLLGLISLLLGQWAHVISQICVDSSLFSSKFFLCSKEDFELDKMITFSRLSSFSNETDIPPEGLHARPSHQCGEGREPFVSYEGLEQLHRFLFVLGITHVLYSCVSVGLAMSKLEEMGIPSKSIGARKLASWPLWAYAIICIFVNIHGLNIYFWVSFSPAILVLLVGTKLQHVVSLLALEIVEPRGPSVGGTQVKPRDELFWFGKPDILLRLIQFISFQNAFEMATFIWSLWGFKQRSCFMKNHAMIVIRLTCGVLVQFWCSYSTVPLNVIVTQMGSRVKKALIAESVRDSLHSWCKRVKERSRTLQSVATRSTCSLGSTIDEGDEVITVASGTLSQSSSTGTLNHLDDHQDSNPLPEQELSFRMSEYLSDTMRHVGPNEDIEEVDDIDEGKVETLEELFQKT